MRLAVRMGSGGVIARLPGVLRVSAWKRAKFLAQTETERRFDLSSGLSADVAATEWSLNARRADACKLAELPPKTPFKLLDR